jgi:ABC-type branched-subunit amino acid transport system substrate-binding protein
MYGVVLLATGVLVTSLTWSLHGADKVILNFGALLPYSENPSFFSRDAKQICELAVHHINEAPDILPNHTLVMHLNDSKCDVGRTIYQLADLLQPKKEKLVALLGEGCSTVTQPIAHATPLWNLALFNFLSTSPALSNTDIYPHFYPVLPSENGLNPARVGVMQQFGWKKAIILIESSEIFDLNAKDLREEMEAAGIESPEFVLLPQNKKYDTIVQFVKVN